MTEIRVQIAPPPQVTVRIERPPNNFLTMEDLEDHYSCEVKCNFCWWKYKNWIALFICVVLASIIGLGIALSKSSTSSASTATNPCETYKDDDFASGVSLECLRTLWANSNCKGSIPDGYMGWWLQSPDGGKMVLCIPPNTGSRCGAGNFGTIRNNMYVCNLDYRGY